MKQSHTTKTLLSQTGSKSLTLGDVIAATYSACGEQQAAKIIQLAMESHLIRFSRSKNMS